MFVYSFWCKPMYSEYGAMYTVVADSISAVIELMKADDPYEFKNELGHNVDYLYECIEKGARIKCGDDEQPRIAEYFMT